MTKIIASPFSRPGLVLLLPCSLRLRAILEKKSTNFRTLLNLEFQFCRLQLNPQKAWYAAKVIKIVFKPVRLFLGAHHVDVVRDEELPDSGHTCAPGRNKFGFAEVRSPFRFLQLLLHSFVLTGANLRIELKSNNLAYCSAQNKKWIGDLNS